LEDIPPTQFEEKLCPFRNTCHFYGIDLRKFLPTQFEKKKNYVLNLIDKIDLTSKLK
jgi:hypothetical protein